MQTNWKQQLWLKAKKEPKSSTHLTSSKDPEPNQNPGVPEKIRTIDLANTLKAFFHSIPEGTSCKIYIKNWIQIAHFKSKELKAWRKWQA